MRKYIVGLVAFFLVFAFVNWKASAEAKKEEQLPCANNKDIEAVMNEKGYSLLLNMTRKEDNKDGIIETLWVGGRNAVITATTKDGTVSCLMSNMNNVIVNPQAIEEVWETYKKQTKQKDI